MNNSMNPITAPLFMVVWRCTRNCVGSCTYCSYIKEYAKDQELTTAQAKHMVDEMAEFGSQWFGISGGEPLVRPDIWEIIEYAEKKHDMKVSLITSGYAWDEERFDKLRKYEVHTAISIDGEKDTNDMIRRKGGYDKALHAMKKLSEVGLLDCLVEQPDFAEFLHCVQGFVVAAFTTNHVVCIFFAIDAYGCVNFILTQFIEAFFIPRISACD